MFFDTHAHYDDKAFDEDRDSLLAALPSLTRAATLKAAGRR